MELLKGPDPQRRDLAYRLLNGFVEVEGGAVQRSGGNDQIEFLVEKIYQHRVRLANRVNLDFEDHDLEEMIAAYEKLNRLCAGLMYNQGWYDASRGL